MNIVWGVVEQLSCEMQFILEENLELEAVLNSSALLFYWPVESGNSTYMD